MKYLLLILLFLYSFSIILPQSKVEGFYLGYVNILGQKITLELEFINSDSSFAIINIPSQGAKNIPVNNFKLQDDNISFEILPPPNTGYFKGKVYGDSIKGEFSQMSFSGYFIFKKSIKPVKILDSRQKNFEEIDISFNNENIKITGTLSYPKDKNNLPAVILINGSGAQNKDSEVFGFKLFEVLADYLTNNNIVVLRCNDRGVGGSTGSVSESTSEDFAKDMVAAYNYLKTFPFVNPKKIGFYGHSEGGIIAPIAASELNNVAFVILVAVPGVNGLEIIIKQTELIMKANNAKEEDIDQAIIKLNRLLNILKENNLNSLKEELYNQVLDEYNLMTAEQKASIKDKDSFINSLVDFRLQQFNNNWFKFFINYDPLPTLQNIKCPILLVYGGKDKQVDYAQNGKIIEAFLKQNGNKNVTTLFFENANHLFQLANTGSPNEYAELDKNYIPGFLEQITNWIKNITN